MKLSPPLARLGKTEECCEKDRVTDTWKLNEMEGNGIQEERVDRNGNVSNSGEGGRGGGWDQMMKNSDPAP